MGEVQIRMEGGELVLDGLIFTKEKLYASDTDRLFSRCGRDIGVERADDGTITALTSGSIVAKR